jgi:hypothetical protein
MGTKEVNYQDVGIQTFAAGQRDEVKFEHLPDAAQYKGSDYANAVRVERGITVERALEIATNDPEIDYFVYVKGRMMVLEFTPGQKYESQKDPLHLVTRGSFIFNNKQPGHGYMRLFRHGDVVFFKNDGKCLGNASGLADVYEKVK